jgi:ankyrin repeat protein
MRLLRLDKNGTFVFAACHERSLPRYAILSHTWSEDDHVEVTFEDIAGGSGHEKAGYQKLLFCAQQMMADKLEHFWIDTCCIKKSDSAELSKAITSMYRWYSQAVKCYVYLTDVLTNRSHMDDSAPNWRQNFRQSRWFTRGWTLQELLAPPIVEFFSYDGQLLGDRSSLAQEISMITTLPVPVLTGSPVQAFTVKERMQWSAGRLTKVSEDRAYCMLGIFGVSLVPNYGEGIHSAVRRLVQEIGQKYQYDIHGVGNILISHAMANEAGLRTAASSHHEHKLQQRRRMFEELKPSSLDARRLHLNAAQAGTCAWFLSHPVFTEWINADHTKDHNGFLWVRGNPGTGKSTLMKFAYEHFEQRVGDGAILISFFFNARGDASERTIQGMWRALLYQLLSYAPDLQATLDEFASAQPHMGPTKPLVCEQLCRTFQQSVLRLGVRRLRCFVDALDECDEQEIQHMVEVMEIIGNNALHATVDFRACFASRHYPNIIYEHGQQVVLEAEPGHQADLEVYVRSHLRKFRSISTKGVDLLQTRILDRANGVFIWVVLVISMLRRELSAGRTLTIENKVAQVPRQLSEIFREILCRDDRDLQETRLAIQCVLFAQRPLSMQEYYYAIMSGCWQSLDGVSEHDPDLVTERAMRLFVSDSTKGLAEVTRSELPTIQFIHESVRDFLIRDQGLSHIWPDLKPDLAALSHEQVKLCCHTYMHASSWLFRKDFFRKDFFRADARDRLKAKSELNAKLPFLEYAVRYLLYHAEESARYVCQADFLRTLNVQRWIEVINLYRSSWSDDYTSEASLLYILAYENCPRLIGTLCRDGPAVGREGERHRYPLYAALARHNTAAVHALLQTEKPPDLSQVSWNPDQMPGHYEPTPLLWALKNGQGAIAQALLKSVDRSSILHATDHNGLDALDHALSRGYASVVQGLLSAGITPRKTIGASSESPLCCAARRGHTELVRLLLDQSSSEEVTEATRAAAEWDSLPTLELLLPRYAKIGATTQVAHDYSSVLKGAVEKGHDAIIDFLLEQDAEEARKIHVRHMALVEAARRGQDSRVQSLLHRGADVEAGAAAAGTALMAAAQSGHQFTTELLLDYGSNPAAIDLHGMTALHHAAAHGRLQVIHTLLRYGADIGAKDQLGRTCLLCAAAPSLTTSDIKAERCVTALLEAGADFNIVDSTGKSLASYAIGRAGLEEWKMQSSRGPFAKAESG